jgi:hypothetical protein
MSIFKLHIETSSIPELSIVPSWDTRALKKDTNITILLMERLVSQGMFDLMRMLNSFTKIAVKNLRRRTYWTFFLCPLQQIYMNSMFISTATQNNMMMKKHLMIKEAQALLLNLSWHHEETLLVTGIIL